MVSKKGIAHIFASYNNIIITVTDQTGAETITKCSGGMVVKADKDQGGPHATMSAAQRVADALKEKGFEMPLRAKPRIAAWAPGPGLLDLLPP